MKKWLLLLNFIWVMPIFAESAEPLIQSRELQNLWVKAGFQIGVDTDPAWEWYALPEVNQSVFVIESPAFYYPPAVMNVRYNRYHPPQDPDTFKQTAYFALVNIQKKYGAKTHFKFRDISAAVYGELKGYEQTSMVELDGEEFSNKTFVGLNRENKLIVLNAVTIPGKIDHLQPAISRMWGTIRFLKSTRAE